MGILGSHRVHVELLLFPFRSAPTEPGPEVSGWRQCRSVHALQITLKDVNSTSNGTGLLILFVVRE